MDRADASIYHLIRKSYYNKYFIEPACSVDLGEMLSMQKKTERDQYMYFSRGTHASSIAYLFHVQFTRFPTGNAEYKTQLHWYVRRCEKVTL